jgi:hypothetical protein
MTKTAERYTARRDERPRVRWRDNLVTALLGTVTSVGGALDAWAHSHVPELETFFTPWHGVLYAGYAAIIGWIALLVLRGRRRGLRGLAAVPVGYGLGAVGALGIAVGGVADATWHTLLGIEVGIEPFLSPPHLLLFLSELLMVTSPLRAAWADPTSPRAPSWRALFPALLSAGLATQLVLFIFMYELAFVAVFPAAQIVQGIPTVLTTNLILIGAVLLLQRRWDLPFGSVAFLFAYQGVLTNVITGLETWPMILWALAAGLVADLLIRRLRPSPAKAGAFRAVAALTTLFTWSGYMLVVWVVGELDWSVPLWSGVVVMATLSSLALALVIAPPPVPVAAQPRAKWADG